MREVIVTTHAVQRMGNRFALERISEAARRRLAERDVREAFAASRIANHKPKAFRLYGEKGIRCRLSPVERFVWTEDSERGYIVKVEDERWVVLTAYIRTNRTVAA